MRPTMKAAPIEVEIFSRLYSQEKLQIGLNLIPAGLKKNLGLDLRD